MNLINLLVHFSFCHPHPPPPPLLSHLCHRPWLGWSAAPPPPPGGVVRHSPYPCPCVTSCAGTTPRAAPPSHTPRPSPSSSMPAAAVACGSSPPPRWPRLAQARCDAVPCSNRIPAAILTFTAPPAHHRALAQQHGRPHPSPPSSPPAPPSAPPQSSGTRPPLGPPPSSPRCSIQQHCHCVLMLTLQFSLLLQTCSPFTLLLTQLHPLPLLPPLFNLQHSQLLSPHP
jgi:hypothetical protein